MRSEHVIELVVFYSLEKAMFIQETRRISGYTVIFVFSFFISIFLNFHVAKSTKAVFLINFSLILLLFGLLFWHI